MQFKINYSTGNTRYISNCGHFSSLNPSNVLRWDLQEMTISKYNTLSNYDKYVEDCKGNITQHSRTL